MRIAVFYNLFFGGAKRVVYEQVYYLKEQGITIDIYTTDTKKDIFNFSKVADNVFSYAFDLENIHSSFLDRIIRDYQNFFSLKRLHKKIATEIDSGNYDVILVHPDRYTQAPFLLRFLHTPSYYYCQEPLRIVYEYSMRFKENVGIHKKVYEEITRMYRKKIDRENVRAAAHTVASCYHVRERMIESYDVYPSVVYPGIDNKIFRPRKVRKLNEVLFIGSKDVFTDGYDLAKAALELIPRQIRPKLHVLSWVKENKERLSDEELVGVYSRSIATLCLSRLETFGLVPLESMACGTPVIATQVSGHRETVIQGKNGFLVDFDPKEIAEKIILLSDKKTAEKMGENGVVDVRKKWSWNVQIKNLHNLLTENLS